MDPHIQTIVTVSPWSKIIRELIKDHLPIHENANLIRGRSYNRQCVIHNAFQVDMFRRCEGI